MERSEVVSNKRLFGAGLGLTGLLAVAGWFAPVVVLHGWLIAFASLAGVAIGCVAWLAIHGLTGGKWGEGGRPALLAGASGLLLLIALIVPLLLADRFVYPWAADPNTAGPGVASAYLNTGFLALRSFILLGSLSLFGLQARRAADAGQSGPGPLLSGLCLLVYAAGMNLSAFDWLLSLDPRFTSSAFGMQVMVAQLMSGLCWVILVTRAPADQKIWGDLGALLFATVLGETYLLLMSFIIHWYGDLPAQADWYLRRSQGGWRLLELGGILVGAVGPMLALLFGRIRRDPAALRLVALAVLTGAFLENVWLVAPEVTSSRADAHSGAWAALAGFVALAAGGCILLGFARLDRLRQAAVTRHRNKEASNGA